MSRAWRAAAQTLIHGRPVSSQALTEAMTVVDREAVRAAAAAVLAPGLAATAVLGPRAAGGAGDVFGRTLFPGAGDR